MGATAVVLEADRLITTDALWPIPQTKVEVLVLTGYVERNDAVVWLTSHQRPDELVS